MENVQRQATRLVKKIHHELWTNISICEITNKIILQKMPGRCIWYVHMYIYIRYVLIRILRLNLLRHHLNFNKEHSHSLKLLNNLLNNLHFETRIINICNCLLEDIVDYLSLVSKSDLIFSIMQTIDTVNVW